MRLSARQALYLSKYLLSEGASDSVSDALGRRLSEEEGIALHDLITGSIIEILCDFEFDDKEPPVWIDPIQTWADDHKGISFQRPNGVVVYTVTGEVAPHPRVGFLPNYSSSVVVRRSSDGKTTQMLVGELKDMVQINQQEDIK